MKEVCQQLQQSVTEWPELESPAFLQGMLIGELCGAETLSVSDFVKALMKELDARSVRERFLEQLYRLYEQTKAGLESTQCDLVLCIPEEGNLFARARAVAQWCEGFIYGFGLTHGDRQDGPEEVKEYLETVIEISRLDVDSLEGETDEGLEGQLEELIEFLRIGAITVYETLHPAEKKPAETGAISEALLREPPVKTLQ